DPHALGRRHLRRADPQPEPRGAVHARLRAAHRDAVESVRGPGPADRGDRVRGLGDLPRALAAIQRHVLGPRGPHGSAAIEVFTHVCGLRTVMPSNPYDAKGLLISAIESEDPVIFLEPKRLYNGPFDGHPDRPVVPWSKHPRGEVPEGYYTVPLESAAVQRPGSARPVPAHGPLVHRAERPARAPRTPR